MQWLKRIPRPLAAMDRHDLALDLTYRYWSGRRDGGLLPCRSVLDSPQFRLLVPRTDWLQGAEGLGHLQPIAAALPGPGCNDPRPLGALLAQDLATVRFTGSPLLQDLLLSCHGRTETWRMLLLPTAKDGIRVDQILQLVREPVPALAEPPMLV